MRGSRRSTKIRWPHYYSKEESWTLLLPRELSLGHCFQMLLLLTHFKSMSKGIKDTLKLKFKKNKDTAEQLGNESRSDRRMMEVFREDEEDDSQGTS